MIAQKPAHQFESLGGVVGFAASVWSFGWERLVEVDVNAVDVLALFGGLLLSRCIDCINHCDGRRLVLQAEL